MIYFVVPSEQEFGMRDYLILFGKELAERVRFLHYERLPRQRRFERGTYILSALDQLSPAMLRLLDELRRRLAEAEDVRVLNHPRRTMRRYELLAELWQLGRNEFRAVRAADDLGGLRYPVFLRSERMHAGAISPLLRSPGELDAALGRALFDGFALRDLLVVEFCDTVSEDGYYRKYAAFVVGTRVIARSLDIGTHWMLKDESAEFTRRRLLEEQEYVARNPHEHQLAEIFEIAGVEYGRMDYAVKDGRVQTWEINLNPTVGRRIGEPRPQRPPDLLAIRDETRECFGARFRAAMAAMDDAPGERPPVVVALDRRLRRAARLRDRGAETPLAGLRRVLRPVKPLLGPVGVLAFAALAKLARRVWPTRG